MSFAMATRRSPLSWLCEAPLMGSALLDEDVIARLPHKCFLLLGEFLEALLPFRRLTHSRDLDRRYLVLGAVGSPVGVLRRDDVGPRLREVEGRVHHARLHSVSHAGS